MANNSFVAEVIFKMVKEELSDHHQLMLCPAHKLELA